MGKCVQVVIPEVDETPIECENITTTNCIQSAVSYEFFNINEGDSITSLFTAIRDKVKTIDDNYIKLSSLSVYADDAAAGVAGVPSGKPYKDTLGYIRFKL